MGSGFHHNMFSNLIFENPFQPLYERMAGRVCLVSLNWKIFYLEHMKGGRLWVIYMIYIVIFNWYLNWYFCIYSYFVSYICMLHNFHNINCYWYSLFIHIYNFHVLDLQLIHIFKSTKFMMKDKNIWSLCLHLVSICFNFIFVKFTIGINMIYNNDYLLFGILKFVCFTRALIPLKIFV